MNKEGVILQIEIPENLPMIHSRSHQIQRLFLNLISNARYALNEKYPGPDKGKILKISAQMMAEQERSMVRVTVRDQGAGIPQELLGRILNPFVTTKPSSEGTGLGLSISHEIVQKHGGRLDISSEHGAFTEVVVELPGI